jgi:hypothetical protein
MINEQSFKFSSNADGSYDQTLGGSRFMIDFDSGFGIQRIDAKSVTIEVNSSSIPYVSPNISVDKNNNHFYLTWNANNYNITIPNGIYGVDDYNNTLVSLFPAQVPPIPSDLLTISGNNPTQKTIITVTDNVTIDFTQANTARLQLGFNSVLVVIAANAFVQSDNAAHFEAITGYQIRTSLIRYGIINGNVYKGIIADIPLGAPPGAYNQFFNSRPQRSRCDELVMAKISQASFQVTDQNGRDIDLLNNPWTSSATIRYYT